MVETPLFYDNPLAVVLQQLIHDVLPAIIGVDTLNGAPFVVQEQELRTVDGIHAVKMARQQGNATANHLHYGEDGRKLIRSESKIWLGGVRSARCGMPRKRNRRIREEPL